MTLKEGEIARIADLARLHLEPDEERVFEGQLMEIVGYIDQLQSLDLPDLAEGGLPEREAEDVIQTTGAEQRRELRAVAPELLDEFFLVPKVKASDGDG